MRRDFGEVRQPSRRLPQRLYADRLKAVLDGHSPPARSANGAVGSSLPDGVFLSAIQTGSLLRKASESREQIGGVDQAARVESYPSACATCTVVRFPFRASLACRSTPSRLFSTSTIWTTGTGAWTTPEVTKWPQAESLIARQSPRKRRYAR
jgi:hypothetical protein